MCHSKSKAHLRATVWDWHHTGPGIISSRQRRESPASLETALQPPTERRRLSDWRRLRLGGAIDNVCLHNAAAPVPMINSAGIRSDAACLAMPPRPGDGSAGERRARSGTCDQAVRGGVRGRRRRPEECRAGTPSLVAVRGQNRAWTGIRLWGTPQTFSAGVSPVATHSDQQKMRRKLLYAVPSTSASANFLTASLSLGK